MLHSKLFVPELVKPRFQLGKMDLRNILKRYSRRQATTLKEAMSYRQNLSRSIQILLSKPDKIDTLHQSKHIKLNNALLISRFATKRNPSKSPKSINETVVSSLGTHIDKTKKDNVLKSIKNKFIIEAMPHAVLNMVSKESQVTLSDMFSKLVIPPAQDDIPAVLRDRTQEITAILKQSPEMGLAMGASLCRRWRSSSQTEYIFSEIIKACHHFSQNRGLEMTIAMFRSFVQRLHDKKLSHRAQLKIGRLYYENGKFGKAVIELAVDRKVKTPSQYDTLAGLVKAVALIRLGHAQKALRWLEWVASVSPDPQQRAKSSFLIGRLHLLYGQKALAIKWLTKVVSEFPDEPYALQARNFLTRITERNTKKRRM